MWGDVPVSEMVGATLTSITGAEAGSEVIVFTAADGRSWKMFHEQNCCESVQIDDVIGDVADLIGTPILFADEVSSEDAPPDDAESYTWTFYKLSTVRGDVTLRWFGMSNGYYSESVDFERLSP